MRYWLATVAGLGVCLAAVVAVDWGLYHLVRTGTCASGGPYVLARPCPPGTGGHVAALVGGIFGAFVGMAIYAARGRGGRPGFIGLVGVMWMLLFVTLAGSAALAAFGPAATGEEGAELTAIVLAAIFVPMGLLPVAAAWLVRERVQAPPLGGAVLAPRPVQPVQPVAWPTASAGPVDPLERLRKLAELRAAGALTDAEYEEQKARLLGEL